MPRALNDRSSALTAQNLIALPERFGCPVWAYDGDIIAERINQLRHFDVIRFAQKACSNIHILRLMREQGVKVDSVSLVKSSVPCTRVINRGRNLPKLSSRLIYWIRRPYCALLN